MSRGVVHNAVITDDLDILGDADILALEELANPDGKTIGVAEDTVKLQPAVLNMIRQELLQGGVSVINAENQPLVVDFCSTAGDFKTWTAIFHLAVNVGADPQVEYILTAPFN